MIRTYFNTFKRILALLPPWFRRRFYVLQVLIVLTSIIDLAGLASFIPVIAAIADKTTLQEGAFLGDLRAWSGLEEDYFLLSLFLASFAFFIFRTLFILFSHWLQAKFVYALSEHIGRETFYQYLESNYEDFHVKESSTIIRELCINPSQFAKFLVMPLLQLSTEILILLMVVGGVAVYNFKVFILLALTIFPIAILFSRAMKKRVREYGLQRNELTPQLYAVGQRGILGYVDTKLRGKEEQLVSDYDGILQRLNRINIITEVLNLFPPKLFELATMAGLVVIFCFGVFVANDTSVVLVLIIVYAAAGYRVIPSLSRVIPLLLNLEQYGYLFGIYEPVLSSGEVVHEKGHMQLLPFNDRITIRDVGFRYKLADGGLFQDLNLSIHKGEVVGLIGRSGSGKTSLANMIAGFLLPSSGEIRIDDQKLSPETIRAWRANISYVQQSPYLEKGTLARNIAFLEDKVDDQRFRDSIRLASLADFVGGDDPYKVKISEYGKNLSGGQKQRVVIARALYHNSQLIILDEATAALDNETEAEVNETVRALKQSGITIIVIAHRHTTLKYCDRIIELQHGKITREVSYNELMKEAV